MIELLRLGSPEGQTVVPGVGMEKVHVDIEAKIAGHNDDNIEEFMPLDLGENGTPGTASRLTIIGRPRLILVT